VYEACESDNSFLNLRPEFAIITNVDPDHLDNHATMGNLEASFQTFLRRVGKDGLVVAGGDCHRCRSLVGSLESEVVLFGAGEGNHYRAVPRPRPVDKQAKVGNGWEFTLYERERPLGPVQLRVPGRQNQLNACAAAALCLRMGIDLETITQALAEFGGVKRRFEYMGEVGGVCVFDDYAHHPTEIRATLAAAKEGWGRRTVAVFQPHLYSRTVYLLDEFASAFGDADVVVVADVYPAREPRWPGVDGSLVAKAIKAGCNGKSVEYIPKLGDIARRLEQLLEPGDMVLTLGAGDVRDVAVDLLRRGNGARQ
jgi:UDP-N-acetylmuramate--alanine ligase